MIKILNNLSYFECYNCQNYFFVHEMPAGMNDPSYCPYCGINFEHTDEVDDIDKIDSLSDEIDEDEEEDL
tara:strand:- start:337 stop:546 length:210 start_codon:yes stop_codon:yes gene_type:complete